MDSVWSEIGGTGGMSAFIAAAFMVAAVIATQIRLIRWMALIAGIAAIVHLAGTDSHGLWMAFAVLFTFANIVNLAMIEYRRRRGQMLDDERELFERVMRVEEPAQQRRLLDVIEWRDTAAGDELMQQGQVQPPLIYIAQGTAVIEADGTQVGECGEGDFLGEMSLISGQRASATVRAKDNMRVAMFDRDAIAALARGVPEIGKALDGALNRSLAAKVQRMNQSIAGS